MPTPAGKPRCPTVSGLLAIRFGNYPLGIGIRREMLLPCLRRTMHSSRIAMSPITR
jgi:hypothetical protein